MILVLLVFMKLRGNIDPSGPPMERNVVIPSFCVKTWNNVLFSPVSDPRGTATVSIGALAVCEGLFAWLIAPRLFGYRSFSTILLAWLVSDTFYLALRFVLHGLSSCIYHAARSGGPLENSLCFPVDESPGADGPGTCFVIAGPLAYLFRKLCRCGGRNKKDARKESEDFARTLLELGTASGVTRDVELGTENRLAPIKKQ